MWGRGAAGLPGGRELDSCQRQRARWSPARVGGSPRRVDKGAGIAALISARGGSYLLAVSGPASPALTPLCSQVQSTKRADPAELRNIFLQVK